MNTELKALIPALRRFAYSLTGSVADADDLLQTTLLKLLSKAPPAEVPLIKWAFTLCRNQWIDDYRASKVRQSASQTAELQQQNFIDGESDMMQQMQLSEVNVAMDKLPAQQREVLALVAIQGFSYHEAAQVLNVAPGTIMSRLARARSALCQYLQPSSPTSEGI